MRRMIRPFKRDVCIVAAVCFFGAVAVGISASAEAEVPKPAASARRVIRLDGTWQAAEGKMAEKPASFDHAVPVPGLLDMAQPPFESPGATVGAEDRKNPWLRPGDPRREAFWYRKTFRLDGPVPAVAMLKVHKARYGTKVFVNGRETGEHGPNFTPGWFDVRPFLRGDGADNELVIRVGAALAQVPPHLTDGWDNEKSRYIPGIYDSVELILCGTPHVVNVQTVPDVEQKAVRAVVEVACAGPAPAEAAVRLTVREVESGREVGAIQAAPVRVVPGATNKVDVTIPVRDTRLWTPEDPFLYELTADTGADALAARFGLRTFATDPATGRALLNGRPYFLRGSNVCIYRFFEDSQRGALPWDRSWVRALHRKFKEMHWNSLRYCIGFPPELWYEIADEEGILIQDEFPVWYSRAKNGWPEAITPDHLAVEYAQWMRERWNHPCVVIWDAQNETANDRVTAAALMKVRDLDLSRRPWDNGWGTPQRPGDISEAHPYRSNGRNFRFSDLARENGVPNNAPRKGAAPPYLINEYGWLWINRDGSLPTLTVDVYQRVLGEDATVEQRRHYYARILAAKTELWRARRKCMGVLHFCGLGYSRSDGQTSDNFIDVKNLLFEPEFFRYVRDAFAPTGLMLDFWEPAAVPGERKTFRVAAYNDLDQPWKGTLRFRVMKGEAVVSEQAQPLVVEALGEAEGRFECNLPKEPGEYVLEAALVREGAATVCSLRDVRLALAPKNLALGRAVRASSEVRNAQGFFPAALAVDGQPDTRWSSEFRDGQWLAVDLGDGQTVSGVELAWEKAGASQYVIEISADGKDWKEVARNLKGACATENLSFPPVQARWVRVRCLKRATAFGVSLWEFRVY